jgi:hypothetical protein
VTRRLRELEAAKDIVVKYEGPYYHALYKFLPEVLRPYYRTAEDRERSEGKYSNQLFTISATQVRRLLAGLELSPYDLLRMSLMWFETLPGCHESETMRP